jgi:hypothetical protein
MFRFGLSEANDERNRKQARRQRSISRNPDSSINHHLYTYQLLLTLRPLADSRHCLPHLFDKWVLPWRRGDAHGQRKSRLLREREDRGRRAGRIGTYVLVGCAARCGVKRRCIGVCADRHAVLQVGRTRLRNDVERPCGVLVFMFVRSPDGVVGGRRRRLGSSERGLLEGCEGRVEGTAQRLGEGTKVFGGGDSTECGHGWKLDRDS